VTKRRSIPSLTNSVNGVYVAGGDAGQSSPVQSYRQASCSRARPTNKLTKSAESDRISQPRSQTPRLGSATKNWDVEKDVVVIVVVVRQCEVGLVEVALLLKRRASLIHSGASRAGAPEVDGQESKRRNEKWHCVLRAAAARWRRIAPARTVARKNPAQYCTAYAPRPSPFEARLCSMFR